MALYHFSVTQISRGKGQSAVASAAYRSGQKLIDDYYGEVQDYTKKGGILHSEIILPNHAPQRLTDRQTLWNEVEAIEKHPKAQLAYSFDIALQNEFTYEENLAMVRQFIIENFTAHGMICDFAIHDPDRGDNGIPNPHFHVIAPIRPLNADGTWGNKQRREYLLDEGGNRIRDENGRCIFNAVPTTDWGDPETLLTWRKNWADLVNSKFREKGFDVRIDHRSYSEQGLDLLPTIHEGPAVSAMEKRGIHTETGDWNRLIRNTNDLIRRLQSQIKHLAAWITELSQCIAETKAESHQYKEDRNAFIDALIAYYDRRNAGAYSAKAKANNIRHQMEAVSFLTKNNISTLDELEAFVSGMYAAVSELRKDVKDIEEEQKKINVIIDAVSDIQETKSVYSELCKIKSRSKSDDFKEKHRAELNRYYRARRIIKENYPDMVVPMKALRKRLSELDASHSEAYARYARLMADAGKTYSLKKAIESDYQQATGIKTITKRKDITK